MIITCGERKIMTPCTGCMCHSIDMQFGELFKGCCSECGCPKTMEAFDVAWRNVEEAKKENV